MPDPLIGGIVGPIAGAIISGNAAEDAADAQRAAASEANQTQLQIFREIKDLQEPWRRAGQVGLRQLISGFGENPEAILNPPSATGGPSSFPAELQIAGWQENGSPLFRLGGTGPLVSLSGFPLVNPRIARSAGPEGVPIQNDFNRPTTRADLEMDPGYEFRLSEAQKAMERSAAARGGLLSGGFAKGLTRYAQDAASQEYQNAWNRRQADLTNRANRLFALSGLGTAAGQQVGSAATNYGNAVSENQLGVGNAMAQSAVSRGNAWNNALGGVTNTLGQWSALQRFGGGGF